MIYADQCPYMPNVVNHAVRKFQERGIEAKVFKFEDGETVRKRSPSAYGVFGVVYNGRLITYHVIGLKALRRLDDVLKI